MIKLFILTTLLLINLNAFGFETAKNNKFEDELSAVPKISNNFTFNFPDIKLVDQYYQPVELSQMFGHEKNIVFAFFFTQCISICETITLSIHSIKDSLPPNTQIAMISIDPNTDTPEILNTYAENHRISDPNWKLLTGDKMQIIKLQKNFEAYRGNKMNHSTSLFIKKAYSNTISEITGGFSIIPQLLTNPIQTSLSKIEKVE